MTIQGLLAAVLLWVTSVAGAFWYGTSVGRDSEIAGQAKIKQAIVDTREAAKMGAADAISKIQIRNTTVQGRVETIVRDNPVYRECSHAPDVLRSINEAITGRPGSAGGGGMPGPDSAGRSNVRGDDH